MNNCIVLRYKLYTPRYLCSAGQNCAFRALQTVISKNDDDDDDDDDDGDDIEFPTFHSGFFFFVSLLLLCVGLHVYGWMVWRRPPLIGQSLLKTKFQCFMPAAVRAQKQTHARVWREGWASNRLPVDPGDGSTSVYSSVDRSCNHAVYCPRRIWLRPHSKNRATHDHVNLVADDASRPGN